MALGGRQEDPRQVERVEDQPRAERFRKERPEKEQIERPAVRDQRGVAAEFSKPSRGLGRRRRAQDVLVGQTDQALNGQGNGHLRIDDDLKLVDGTKRTVVAHSADLEYPVAAWREPGGLEIERDQVVQERRARAHAAGELPPRVSESAPTGRRSRGSNAITRSIMIAAASRLESGRPSSPRAGTWTGSPMRTPPSAGRGIHDPRGMTRSDPQLATGTITAPECRAMKPAPACTSPMSRPFHDR